MLDENLVEIDSKMKLSFDIFLKGSQRYENR